MVDPSTPCFARFKKSVWGACVRSVVLEQWLNYIPRSGRLAAHVPCHAIGDRADVSWWKPPDGGVPYPEDTLRWRIGEARGTCLKSSGIMPRSGHDANDEDLMRAGLLLREPQVFSAEIEALSPLRGMVVHRCYFHSDPSSGAFWADVYRYDEDVIEHGYSAYFRTAARDEAFRKSLIAVAELLPRE